MISQVRSQLLAFHRIELQNLTKLTPAISCSCCWFLSLCSGSSSRIPEESTSLGLRGRRVQNGQRRGTRTGEYFLSTEESLFPNPVSSLWTSAYPHLHCLVRGKGDLDPLVSKVKRCFQSWGWQKSPSWYPRVLACPELWFRLMISPDSQFW